MFRRLLRSLIALATVIVAYQAYVLLAVPLLEPPLDAWQGRPSTASDREQATQSTSRYQKLLGNYFPEDHWTQQQPPIVLGNWPALLVVDKYDRQANGWIKIDKFALLLFPTPLEEGVPPPRDAVVLEAPGGARLQFDENFRPDRFQIGQIQQGEFPGTITIRSEMREPGPADDLLVETSKLAMNSKLLYTNSPVRFRLGANIGSGRELEIRFQREEPAAASKLGVSSLEIRRDVQLRIDLKTDSLLPKSGSHALRGNPIVGRSGGPDPTQSVVDLRYHAERGNESDGRGNEEREEAPRPPVDITCTGPFQFDFLRYVASFDQNVQVRQLDPNGPGDRLDAQQLDIHFAPKAGSLGEAASAAGAPGRRQQTELARLEPAMIVAQGLPVVIVSPSRRAEARSQHIQLDLRGRRVTLSGGRDTTLVSGLNVLKAPKIEYWHPANDAGTNVGRFRAGGPGSLYYVVDPAKPDEVFQAAWQKSVELGRSNGQPVLAIDGRPQLGVAGMGRLTADQLTIWFRELVGVPAAGGLPLAGQGAGGDRSQLIPDRLSASGQVDIASPALTARTEQLAATFEAVIDASAAGGTKEAAAVSSNGAALPPRGAGGPLLPVRRNEAPTTSYHVEADRLQLGVRLHGREAAPTSVECDGNVVLREIQLAPNTQQPIEVRGARLTAVGLDGGAARIKVSGTGATGAAQYVSSAADAARVATSQLAQLAGRGMTLFTAAVEIDQQENRLSSNGPGQATILVARDLNGQATATPTPFDIRWNDGMEFDGRRATFCGRIEGRRADDTLRCDQLVAKLAMPIKFNAPQTRIDKNATEVVEIEFQGQVMIDHYTRDQEGPASHDRLELAQLSINQQTGVISGIGPGIIRSTHYGNQPGGLAALTAGGRRSGDPNARPAAQSKLNFARIDFDERLAGNLFLKQVAFYRRVRAVYGPVDSWEQELDANRPETLPPRAFVISCDELQANEDPVAARAAANSAAVNSAQKGTRPVSQMQLLAVGNVRIKGQSGAHGTFVATALRASYDQGKSRLTLEGDPRSPATVSTQRRPGEPVNPVSGTPIIYDIETETPTIGGFHGLHFTFPEESPAPAGQRR